MNKTKIEWTDFSANPIRYREPAGKTAWGCIKASEGCQHCYAESISKRFRGPEAGFTAKRMEGLTPYVDEAELKAMLSPRRLPAGSKVFVGDMTDIFGPWVPFDMLDRLFAAMALRSDVVFQVLTKRPERMREYIAEGPFGAAERVWGKWNALALTRHAEAPEWPGWPLPNVWLGVSVENQHWADRRIPELLACPAAVRFASCEPMLGPVDFGWDDWGYVERLDWVIFGGESGPWARPCDIAWIRAGVEQCRAAGVPVFVKQLGAKVIGPDTPGSLSRWIFEDGSEWTPPVIGPGAYTRPLNAIGWRTGSKGGDMSELPEDLRVREMPR